MLCLGKLVPTGARLELYSLVVSLGLLLGPAPVHTYIYAHYSNMTPMSFEDRAALFGSLLPLEGLKGVLVAARPLNACTPIEPPPPPASPSEANLTNYIVLIRRFDCNFDIKVLHAQQAGYSAAIVHNMYSDTLLNMNFSNVTIAEEIEIPSVFTSFYASQVLHNFIIPDKGAYIILKPDFPFPLAYYLIPFTGVVGMIILVMVVILVVRCVQYRKRLRKNRLTKEQLKKIPIHKFSKGDEYDVCAICLDEYEEGDKLRVLPCSHAYHCRCVDPWLTQTKKTCPVCKQRVTRPNPECSESSSEEEEDAGSRTTDEEAASASLVAAVMGAGLEEENSSERTPLLRASNPPSPLYGGSPPSSHGNATINTVTTITTAQCLAHTPQRDSPLLGYDGYYSPEEDDTESEGAEEDENDDTAQLIGRGPVRV